MAVYGESVRSPSVRCNSDPNAFKAWDQNGTAPRTGQSDIRLRGGFFLLDERIGDVLRGRDPLVRLLRLLVLLVVGRLSVD